MEPKWGFYIVSLCFCLRKIENQPVNSSLWIPNLVSLKVRLFGCLKITTGDSKEPTPQLSNSQEIPLEFVQPFSGQSEYTTAREFWLVRLFASALLLLFWVPWVKVHYGDNFCMWLLLIYDCHFPQLGLLLLVSFIHATAQPFCCYHSNSHNLGDIKW